MVTIPQRVLDGARNARQCRNGYLYTRDNYAYCFADGSCMEPVRNAGVGVWFGHDHAANVSEPLPVPGTNNRAELLAILYAIHAARECGLQRLEIRSDSQYAINCVTAWLPTWKQSRWRTGSGSAVENQDEIRAIDEAHSLLHVRYVWVEGHSGDIGNEAADKLARAGAAQSLANYRSGQYELLIRERQYPRSTRVDLRKLVSFSALLSVTMPYYAVLRGVNPGIYSSWRECRPQVVRFSRNEYRKFDTRQDAENYLNDQGSQVVVDNRILTDLLQIVKDLVRMVHARESSHGAARGVPLRPFPPTGPQVVVDNRMLTEVHQIVKDLVRMVHARESSHEAVRGVPQCPCRPTCSGSAEKRRAETDIISVDPPAKIFRLDLVFREAESVVASAVRATYEKPQIPPKILDQARKAKVSDFTFTLDGFAICYTDGSCITHLQISGVGVWFGKDHVANISEPLPVPGTSNRAELTAVLYAIHVAKEAGLSKLEVRTDSIYTKNCVTVWLPKWKGNNWQTTANKDVLNQNEIRAIDEAFNYVEVKFKWIQAHSGEEGNEAADRLARLGVDKSLRNSES
ncbi:unnamed protein product [Notodromas monacha]|uniref:Ribonuclease H n=1 Tax=Notodromas monacha TaxID=399045 RepID=A0A7R9BZB0_9CRUS|nr:unnamed protein product [Notodromas monacha]CAG0923210.1 unnamed protein product [Notodromas monacha]